MGFANILIPYELQLMLHEMPEEIVRLATFMVGDVGNMIMGDTACIIGGSGVIVYHK